MHAEIEDGQIERYRGICDYIFDVRSPAEYAADHIPGAINVPMLDNAQRAEIGILHRHNPFEARRKGAVYALSAIRTLLSGPILKEAPCGSRFMIYCARGGQRSRSVSMVLSEIGFAVFRLKAGYKTYRSYIAKLLEKPPGVPVYVLHGYTGSHKTQILTALKDKVNIIDLEALANHRGSLLGLMPGENQPPQRCFESRIASALAGLKPDVPLLVEGESRRIGECQIPNGLWRAMQNGRHLWLEVDRATRTRNILDTYHQWTTFPELAGRLQNLRRFLPKTIYAELLDLMQTGSDWVRFVELLLAYHYDPHYGKAKKLTARRIIDNPADPAAAVLAQVK